MKTKLKAVTLAALAVLSLAPMQVLATYPGFNGKIYFVEEDRKSTSVQADNTYALKSVRPDGTAVKTLRTSEDQPLLSIDPAGKYILFSQDTLPSYADSETHLFLMKVDGSGLQDLGKGYAGSGDGSWTPDGSKFVAYSDGALSVYNADGTGKTALPNVSFDQWVDNTRYLANNGGDLELRTLGGATTVVADGLDGFSVSLSPDKTQIAFNAFSGSNAPYDNVIYIAPLDGSGESQVYASGPTPVVSNELYFPRLISNPWSADGSKLYFTAQDPGDSSTDIFSVTTDGDTIDQVTDVNLSTMAYSPTGSPNASKIVFEQLPKSGGNGTVSEVWTIDTISGEATKRFENTVKCFGSATYDLGTGGSGGGDDTDPGDSDYCTFLNPRWSPDSQYLLYNGSVITFAVATGATTTLSTAAAVSAAWGSSTTPLAGGQGKLNPLPFVIAAAGLGLVGTLYLKKHQKLPRFKLTAK